jgi:hypothetical protein
MKHLLFSQDRFASACNFCHIGSCLPCMLIFLLLITACGDKKSAETTEAMQPATATPSSTEVNVALTTPSSASITVTPSTAASSSSATPNRGTTAQATRMALKHSLSQYYPVLKSQIAQSLHLTSDQLTQQIQAGQTLTSIASTQGISAAQLSALLATALATSFAPAVQNSQITQQQLTKLTQCIQLIGILLDALLMTS